MRERPVRPLAGAAGTSFDDVITTVRVRGARITPRRLALVAALWSTDTETITIRVDETAEPRVTRLGATLLITLGRLEELPALLKRAGR